MNNRFSTYKNCLQLGYLAIMACIAMSFITINLVEAGTVKIEKISYNGWNECYRISNGEVELIAVAEIGPRILQFGFVGGENLFYVAKDSLGKKGGAEWIGYGGHRFWLAPEHPVTTYYPDNIPVKAVVEGDRLTLTAAPEVLNPDLRKTLTSYEAIEKKLADTSFRESLGIRKELIISMKEDGEVTIEHRLTQEGIKSLDIAPWALTIMNQGGFAIVPNPPYAPHGPANFLPVRSFVSWSYTDFSDPRLGFLKKYTTLRQNSNAKLPTKIGFSYTQGWAAYSLKENLFIKLLEYQAKAHYPDQGCSVEMFTNADMLEMESLGPMITLKPQASVSHIERWKLFKTQTLTPSEQILDKVLTPLKLGL